MSSKSMQGCVLVNVRAAEKGRMWVTFHGNFVELTPSQPHCKLGSKNRWPNFSFQQDWGEHHHFDAGLSYLERQGGAI